MVWAGTVVAAVSAVYGINESERAKKKAKSLMKKEDRQLKRESQIAGMQDMAARNKAQQEQEILKKKSSGVQSTLLTGSKTLG